MSGIVGDNTGRGSGTIKSSGVGADDITGAEIADDSIDSEHYVDGSIDPEHLADNAVTLAKMASGTDGNIISYDASGDPVAIATGTDGQVLTSTGAGSPPAFETPAGGGKLLQVISTVKTDFQTTTSSTPVDITGLSATITPSATSSKILVTVHITHGATGERGSFHLLESSTEIVRGDAHGSTRVRGLVGGQTADSNGSTSTVSMMYLHSPSSTSALTYKMTFQSRGSGQYIDINRPTAGADDAWAGTGISTITVMEIGA